MHIKYLFQMFRIVWFFPKNFESVCSNQCPDNFIANASQIVIVAIVDGEYSYKWSQISAPEDSHGYIEGATTKNVKLTKVNDIVDMEGSRLVSHILFHMGKFVF